MIRKLSVLAAVFLLTALPLRAALGEVKPVETVEKGRVTRVVWQDDAGAPAAGPEGWAEIRYAYHGKDTEERYYTAEGTPFRMSGGYYGRIVTRDGKDRITAIWFLDENGEKALNDYGYARIAMTYTSFGGVRFLGYYGTGKKTVTVPSLGYAAVTTEYSGKSITVRTWQDENGNPVDNSQGYAVMRQKLNAKYQVIRTRYEHADGSPALCPDGWSLCVKERDGRGRITSIKYYDTEEKLTDRGAGYAWEEFSYDGNDVLVTRFDRDGNPVPCSENAVTVRRRMKDDLIVSETYLKADGTPAVGPLGVTTVEYGYDYQGRIETVLYRNAEGAGTICSLGYAGYRDTRDGDGVVISRTYLGTDGKAMEISGGYSEERYIYNAARELTETRRYDLNGNAVQ